MTKPKHMLLTEYEKWLKEYNKLLQDDRWKRKRAEILLRDDYTCQHCGAKGNILHVHHIIRSGRIPWEIPNDWLITLCLLCHNEETNNHYGAYAQKYLTKELMVRRKFMPSFIRNLTNAVKGLKSVRLNAMPKPFYRCVDCPKEEYSKDDAIREFSDLLKVMGRLTPHFTNDLARMIEKIPDFNSGTTLEFWFEQMDQCIPEKK